MNIMPPKLCPMMSRPLVMEDHRGGPMLWEVYCTDTCAWWTPDGCNSAPQELDTAAECSTSFDCRKCGNPFLRVKLIAADNLLCNCRACGYEWSELPLDAKDEAP
jgi:hypothetical protein